MDVDALSVEEKKKHVDKNLCFFCHKPGHYSCDCHQRRLKGQRPSTSKPPPARKAPAGKKRFGARDLHTHIRELIAENIGDDEGELNDFLDEVEEKGF